jgi:hypothetical protein
MPYRAPNLTAPIAPRRRRWAFVAAAVVLTAAAAVLAARRASAPPPVAAVTTVVATLPWPAQARAWVVHRDADGGREVAFGPLRLRAGADRAVTAAAVRFEAAIVASVPVGGGWVFLTADGAVAAAEGFLGAPRALGRLPCAFKAARDSVGRAVAIDLDGALYTTDGTTPLVRSRLPDEAAARAAAFMDGRHGAAVLRDGRVLLTADGGQTWDPFALADEVAWDVAPADGGVAIESTRGREVFRWEGAGAPGMRRHSHPPRELDDRAAEEGYRSFINARAEVFAPSGALTRCSASAVPAEPTPPDAQRVYACRAPQPLRPLTLLPLPYQARVDASDLLAGAESGPVRGRFWRERPDATGETFARVSWMGVDGAGRFHGVTHASGRGLGLRWPVEQRGPLRVEAATRRGVLVWTADPDGRPLLGWGAPERPFVRVADAFVAQSPVGLRTFASPSPDGGALVLFAAPRFEGAREAWSTGYSERAPQVGVGVAIDPAGAVTARRGFVGDDPGLTMIARSPAAVGPVVRDRGEPPRWRMIPVGEGAAPALPSMRWDAIAACGAAPATGTTLEVAYPPITLLVDAPEQEVTVVSRAELEVGESSVCVRALALGGRRLTALPGDRFDGALRCEPSPRR